MANSKLRCLYCKEYFPRDQMISTPRGNFCTYDHATKHGIAGIPKTKKKLAAAEKKVWAKEKREFRQSDVKVRKAAAKKACHAYIRARDQGKGCICCHRPLGAKYDAGHWLESGNNPQIRYDERNIHAQSVYCNQYKGGDSGDYEKNLRLKIGDEAVDDLLSKKGGTVKRTGEDYLEIEQYFKNKLKELEG